MKSFCKPKIKVSLPQYQSLMSSCNLYLVPLWWNFRPIFQGLALWLVSRFGKEWVTKGQNIDHIWLYNSDYRNGYINTYHHWIFQGWYRVGFKGTEYWPLCLIIFTLISSYCNIHFNIYFNFKVGTEWVTKGQNIDQSYQSVAGIARGLYGRYCTIQYY